MKRPPELYLLYLFLGFLSLNAIGGGGALMLAPDGSLLQIPLEWMEHSPFTDFFIPGFILFSLNGLLPLAVLYGLIVRPDWRFAEHWNIYSQKHWSWSFSLYCGIISILWIAFQQMMTRYFILQPVIIVVGMLIVITTLLPRVQRWYTVANV